MPAIWFCMSSQMPLICRKITQDLSPVQYFTSEIKITLRLLMVPFWHSALSTAVVASAAEAEYAALFHTAQEAVNLRNILQDLGYSQSPTNIGLATNTVKQHRSKSIG